jgi:hypothetical protein
LRSRSSGRQRRSSPGDVKGTENVLRMQHEGSWLRPPAWRARPRARCAGRFRSDRYWCSCVR